MTSLLLLDLDGVVAYEIGPPLFVRLEIIVLHELLDKVLHNIGVPVVVVTHRSRTEAHLILKSAGLTRGEFADVLTAEDILTAALKSRQRWRLLQLGLRKSWILPEVETRHKVARRDIAFIDDRLDNLEDMRASGIGLGLLAPSGVSDDGSKLISFDINQIGSLLKDWNYQGTPHILTLAAREINVEQWCRTGLSTESAPLQTINRIRACGRIMRRLFGTIR
jgi:hypothetical protein